MSNKISCVWALIARMRLKYFLCFWFIIFYFVSSSWTTNRNFRKFTLNKIKENIGTYHVVQNVQKFLHLIFFNILPIDVVHSALVKVSHLHYILTIVSFIETVDSCINKIILTYTYNNSKILIREFRNLL